MELAMIGLGKMGANMLCAYCSTRWREMPRCLLALKPHGAPLTRS